MTLAEVIEREDEALRLLREPPPSRPKGRRRGPGQTASVQPPDLFDGSAIALRKFTSSELLEAGFDVAAVAARQGHSPQVLL